MTKVSVIIVTHNSEKDIASCLSSVPKSKDIEVIIADNLSTDNTINLCADRKCKIVELKENAGYAKGNNVGAKHAKGDFVLIMNPDVILNKNTIKTLLAEYKCVSKLENSDKIILSPKVNLLDGRINYFGADIHFLGFAALDHFGEKDKIHIPRKKTMMFTGSCFLMKRKNFLDLRGFDEDYFMYHEDTDFAVRALQKKYKIYVTNQTEITHAKHEKDFQLSDFKYYFVERNRISTVLKASPKLWKTLLSLFLFEPVMVLQAIGSRKILKRLKIYFYLSKNINKIMKKRKNTAHLNYTWKLGTAYKFVKPKFANYFFNLVEGYSKLLYYVIYK